jgi:hypothetical protein
MFMPGPGQPPNPIIKAHEAEIRHAWEKTPESASKIAARFGVTKSVVIGYAQREGWISFRPGTWSDKPRTIFDRLDALHARMDAVLAACRLPAKNDDQLAA